jgi:hypothetical protein
MKPKCKYEWNSGCSANEWHYSEVSAHIFLQCKGAVSVHIRDITATAWREYMELDMQWRKNGLTATIQLVRTVTVSGTQNSESDNSDATSNSGRKGATAGMVTPALPDGVQEMEQARRMVTSVWGGRPGRGISCPALPVGIQGQVDIRIPRGVVSMPRAMVARIRSGVLGLPVYRYWN